LTPIVRSPPDAAQAAIDNNLMAVSSHATQEGTFIWGGGDLTTVGVGFKCAASVQDICDEDFYLAKAADVYRLA